MSPARRMRPQARQSWICSVAPGWRGHRRTPCAAAVGRDQFQMAMAERPSGQEQPRAARSGWRLTAYGSSGGSSWTVMLVAERRAAAGRARA
jgi:hypothetical protein